MTAVPFAVPYRRFSTKTQTIGSSEVRQDSGFDLFILSSGLPSAPPEFCYWERGKSGYKGVHRTGDFGRLLADSERQAFPVGSVIWFEDMDRFSRQKLSTVLADWDTITEAGYSIVVGSLGTTFTANTPDMERWGVISKAIWARDESAKKAIQLAASWKEKRKKADGITKHHRKSKVCPSWLSVSKDGKSYEKNEKEPLMRRAALMAIDGHGITSIRRATGLSAGLLTQLHSRTLIGEWQPQSRGEKRLDLGAAKSNYYPAILTLDHFRQLQFALQSRAKQVKRRGADFINLFTGLLFSEGKRLNAMKESRGSLIYRPFDRRGACVLRNVVETAILDLFVNEITPATLNPKGQSVEQIELADVEATVADKTEKRAAVREQFLDEKGNGFLIEILNQLTAEIDDLERLAEELRGTLAARKGDTLGLVRDLATHISGLSGDDLRETRIRLSAAIGKMVRRIDLQITGRATFGIVMTLQNGNEVRRGDTSSVKTPAFQGQITVREHGM
jgi:hypothetical protein